MCERDLGFIAGNEHHIIAQAGRRFYRIYPDYSYEELSADTARIKTTEVSVFVYQDKLWVLCGDFIAYGKWDDEWQIRRVEDFAYIPTTTTNIDNDEVADTARATLEQVNLLSKWRRNEMVGTSHEAWFTVDSGCIDADSEVTVELALKTEDGVEFKTYVSSGDKIIRRRDRRSAISILRTGEYIFTAARNRQSRARVI